MINLFLILTLSSWQGQMRVYDIEAMYNNKTCSFHFAFEHLALLGGCDAKATCNNKTHLFHVTFEHSPIYSSTLLCFM